MSKTTFILIGITVYIVTVVLIVLVLNFIAKKNKNKYQKEITNLERDKNLIISASILSELNKVEALVNNDVMKEKYENWQARFKNIREEDVPKITDALIEIEEVFNKKKYKDLNKLLITAELEINYIKTKTNFLLNEIKEITLSEEKNREKIIKLKSDYREIVNRYKSHLEDYQSVSVPLELQLENVEKLFSAFENLMDEHEYTEVGKVVKAIADLIGNLKIVIEESPSIILMCKTLIPKKMEDIENISSRMVKNGYNLDYLNIEYNIKESNKKVQDVMQRLNVLNLEDSIFELKTILDYFDTLYMQFDKERNCKKIFEDLSRSILIKITNLEKVNNELFKKIEEFKFSFDLSNEDVTVIDDIHDELVNIRKSYEITIDVYRNRTFAYSKLSKEMENISNRVQKVNEKLDFALKTLGNLKEEEKMARNELNEIKEIFIKCKGKIKNYKLPLIPKKFYVELSEASEAITILINELDQEPLSMKNIKIRVDTARDLTLKVFNTANELVKTAKMAEIAIVYGNRYRPINKDVDFNLAKAENMFYKGNYKLSLENAINAINIVEPGIYKRLLEEYGE